LDLFSTVPADLMVGTDGQSRLQPILPVYLWIQIKIDRLHHLAERNDELIAIFLIAERKILPARTTL
jgi:hypothetical protein